MKASISSILDLNGMLDIVDIGANDIEGEQLYEKLVKADLANVFGFEPKQKVLARLITNKGPNATYIGKAYIMIPSVPIQKCRFANPVENNLVLNILGTNQYIIPKVKKPFHAKAPT